MMDDLTSEIPDCPHPKPCVNPYCYMSDKALIEGFRDELWEQYLAGDKEAYPIYLDVKSTLEHWEEI